MIKLFTIGLIKSKGVCNVAQKIRQFSSFPRLVFDYLKIPANNHISAAVEGEHKFTVVPFHSLMKE